MTIQRTIVPYPMKIGVTSFPQSRLKIKVKYQQCRSRRLHLLGNPLSERNESVRILMEKNTKTGFLRSNKYPEMAHSRHHIYRNIACFKRRQEYLSASTRQIVPRIALACAPTGTPRMYWEGLWEVKLML